MRIVAGRLGGRNFDSPHGHRTHPMSEKMRGALFSVLGDIKGLDVLDCYAGSGALGFEALSRGASSALLIESDLEAQRAILKNIKTLDIGTKAILNSATVLSWCRRHPNQTFSIIVADPPYDKVSVLDIRKIVKHLATVGVFVLSWPGMLEIPEFDGLTMVSHKTYGDSQLIFYKHRTGQTASV